MSDRLLVWSENRTARSLAKSLGVPLPPRLERVSGPWVERPLADRRVGVVLGARAGVSPELADALARLGANVAVLSGDPAPFEAAGEAWARAPRALEEGERLWALVVDATEMEDVASLRGLWEGLSPRVRSLQASGRVLLIGRPHDAAGVGLRAAAARRGLDGFVRSLGRELGRSGVTANLLVVPEEDAALTRARLLGVLHFLLSPRSAYVSGQPWVLSESSKATSGPLPPLTRPLEGRVALVTGAARGIGAATARALAREGARVIVHDHPSAQEEAAAVAAEVHGEVLLADLADPAGRAALLADPRLVSLDVLVQNAGITRDRTLARMSAEEWDLLLAVNLEAPLILAAELGPRLNPGGAMVCLSSIGGIAGNMGQTNYALSKAAIIGMVDQLAPGFAARGVAVSAVAPGFIETRMTAAIPFATREVARRLANLSQGGLPEDIAEVILFLASPSGRALHGRVLRVCGGNYVGA